MPTTSLAPRTTSLPLTTVVTQDPRQMVQCDLLRVPLCQDLGYSHVATIRGAGQQQTSAMSLLRYSDLMFYSSCSRDLRLFLCSLYLVPCKGGLPLPPCRSMCLRVKMKCQREFSSQRPWPIYCGTLSDDNCLTGVD